MTVYNESDAARRQANEHVHLASAVPADRVRWGPILAGTFTALTALAVLNTLGSAIGLSAWDAGDDARHFAIGAGVWGVISLLLSFALGGFIAGRSEALSGRRNGMFNGFMVAAVGIPLLIFMLGTAAASAARTAPLVQDTSRSVAHNASDTAITASATIKGDNVAPANGDQSSASAGDNQPAAEEARKVARNTAWGMLLALVLSLGAASLAGGMGASYDHRRNGDSLANRDIKVPV
jgi:hypothetical protein